MNPSKTRALAAAAAVTTICSALIGVSSSAQAAPAPTGHSAVPLRGTRLVRADIGSGGPTDAQCRQLIGGDPKGANRNIGAGIFDRKIVGAFHRLVVFFQGDQATRHRFGVLHAGADDKADAIHRIQRCQRHRHPHGQAMRIAAPHTYQNGGA